MERDNNQNNLENTVTSTSSSLSKRNNKPVKIIITIVIVGGILGLIFYGGYKSGYNRGKEDGIASAKTNVPNLFESIPNIFNSLSGKVEEVSSSSITIKTESDKKTLEVSESIKVNKGDQQLSITDVKKGDEVIVYSIKKDDVLTPSRIVVK